MNDLLKAFLVITLPPVWLFVCTENGQRHGVLCIFHYIPGFGTGKTQLGLTAAVPAPCSYIVVVNYVPLGKATPARHSESHVAISN